MNHLDQWKQYESTETEKLLMEIAQFESKETQHPDQSPVLSAEQAQSDWALYHNEDYHFEFQPYLVESAPVLVETPAVTSELQLVPHVENSFPAFAAFLGLPHEDVARIILRDQAA